MTLMEQIQQNLYLAGSFSIGGLKTLKPKSYYAIKALYFAEFLFRTNFPPKTLGELLQQLQPELEKNNIPEEQWSLMRSVLQELYPLLYA